MEPCVGGEQYSQKAWGENMAKAGGRNKAHQHANCGPTKRGGADNFFRDKTLEGPN